MESQAEWVDLRPFCEKENTRYQLHSPFVQGGEWCATDGRILACVPAPGLPDTIPTGTGWSGQKLRLPNISEIISPITGVKDWHPLPALVTNCDKCGSTGRVSKTCICEDCGHRHSQEHNCDCNAMIGNRRIAVAYALKIYALPDVTWGVVDEADGTSPLFFRFAGGGRGVAMPLDLEQEKPNE